MTDYYKLFSEMLDEPNGSQKVADYLNEVAEQANAARVHQQKKAKRNEAAAEIARIIHDYFGDFKIFTIGNYKPADAAEAVVAALIDMEEVVNGNSEIFEWLNSVE
jgi:hypothetical protein